MHAVAIGTDRRGADGQPTFDKTGDHFRGRRVVSFVALAARRVHGLPFEGDIGLGGADILVVGMFVAQPVTLDAADLLCQVHLRQFFLNERHMAHVASGIGAGRIVGVFGRFGGDSLLKLAQEKNVGVIGLKPFGAGTTFGLKPQQIKGQVDPRAHVLVKEMLQEPRISAIIPGVNIASQLDENVKGSYEKNQPQTPADKRAIFECTKNYYAHLTPDYRWLHRWERV